MTGPSHRATVEHMTEQRYMLPDAARVLAAEECSSYGHSWDVIEVTGRGPTEIICTNCGETHAIQDSNPEERK